MLTSLAFSHAFALAFVLAFVLELWQLQLLLP
jgi:hypothetical protein